MNSQLSKKWQQLKNQERILLTKKELVNKLIDILSESDSSYLVEIYNQISSIKIKNIGNEIFEGGV